MHGHTLDPVGYRTAANHILATAQKYIREAEACFASERYEVAASHAHAARLLLVTAHTLPRAKGVDEITITPAGLSQLRQQALMAYREQVLADHGMDDR